MAKVWIFATSYDEPTRVTTQWAKNLKRELADRDHDCTLVEKKGVTQESLADAAKDADYILFYGHGQPDRLYAQETGFIWRTQPTLVDAADLRPLGGRPLYAVACHALLILGEAYGNASPSGTFIGYGRVFGFPLRDASEFEDIASKAALAFVNGDPVADIVQTLQEDWDALRDAITERTLDRNWSPQEEQYLLEAMFSAQVNGRYVGTRPRVTVGST